MKILQGIATVLAWVWSAFIATTIVMLPIAMAIWCFKQIGGVL